MIYKSKQHFINNNNLAKTVITTEKQRFKWQGMFSLLYKHLSYN